MRLRPKITMVREEQYLIAIIIKYIRSNKCRTNICMKVTKESMSYLKVKVRTQMTFIPLYIISNILRVFFSEWNITQHGLHILL